MRNHMKSLLFRRAWRDETIAALYGMIVAQARLPAFYQAYGVPDTAAGRLEMILLHTFLFFRRVGDAAGELQGLGQEVFDLFCSDMDGNLREMGVGDLAIPRQMQRIGEAFYGRTGVYDSALAAGDEQALTQALLRNVFSGISETSSGPRRLAAYMMAAVDQLAHQDDADFAQGRIGFPDLESLAA
jgi:cytochrome b pre-mRNA-processing protein 3